MERENLLTEPLLSVRGLTKRFGSLTANRSIDLDVRKGSIHAILGENGAGKSTLMKMLYGVYKPDEGSVEIDGRPAELHPPAKARAQGVGMVFQDFRVVPALTVLDNIALAVEKGWGLRRRQLRRRIVDVSAKYGLAVDPDASVWELDLGQRQRLEIVKVLLMPGTRIIIFDEPTSVLVPQEVGAFLDMLRRLREDGYGILLITHKINEVLAVADEATVLRSGEIVFRAGQGEELAGERLIAAMMGDKTLKAVSRTAGGPDEAPAAMAVRGASIRGDHGELALEAFDLDLPAGRITGVAGISGSGQRELAEALFGLRPLASGTLEIGGKPMKPGVRSFIEAGVTLVSEDPVKESVVPGFTILEHMALDGYPLYPKGLGVDWSRLRAELTASPEAAALSVAAPDRRAETLSGGNIQRMVLARALIRRPGILIVSYPSRGLDIGTAYTVQRQLLEAAAQGAAVLLLSEDLDELFKLSDRLVVLAGKRLLGPYRPEEIDQAGIGRLMLKGESA
ncbi:ABC transporter ATP-binding protein [Paenibacillus pasadenensis]|uniref:ABC transporter ATP-binding protein n=1 Tax=Paenibacillus pasadenensis TaxID=217090 RepID=A0A2N5NAR5_9BACL|nr:ATP-binding cassette domain-containing protein [Paenibacillus pasadenensis]PLT47447.1 ABC transporter ATP-binding protein [Paenibacillus pasadenensis]